MLRHPFKFIQSIFSPKDLTQYGKWAIVTGGSDGIGRGYALELAKRGLNICIISRTESKIKQVCEEIQKNYPSSSTDFICFNFSDGNYEELYKNLADFEWFANDVGVLVNNVGVLPYAYENYAKYGPNADFDSLKNEMIVKELNSTNLWNLKVNIHSQNMMTGFILPNFCKKKKGVIVNLSSIAANQPLPYWALYSAAKSYNYHFGEAIRKELEYDYPGIICQTLRPHGVLTNLASKHWKEGLMFPTPETFCKHAVNTIGYLPCTAGYLPHEIENFIWPLVYKNLSRNRFVRIHDARRKRLLKDQKLNPE